MMFIFPCSKGFLWALYWITRLKAVYWVFTEDAENKKSVRKILRKAGNDNRKLALIIRCFIQAGPGVWMSIMGPVYPSYNYHTEETNSTFHSVVFHSNSSENLSCNWKLLALTPLFCWSSSWICNRYATGSYAHHRVNCDSLARGGQNGKWMHLKTLSQFSLLFWENA